MKRGADLVTFSLTDSLRVRSTCDALARDVPLHVGDPLANRARLLEPQGEDALRNLPLNRTLAVRLAFNGMSGEFHGLCNRVSESKLVFAGTIRARPPAGPALRAVPSGSSLGQVRPTSPVRNLSASAGVLRAGLDEIISGVREMQAESAAGNLERQSAVATSLLSLADSLNDQANAVLEAAQRFPNGVRGAATETSLDAVCRDALERTGNLPERGGTVLVYENTASLDIVDIDERELTHALCNLLRFLDNHAAGPSSISLRVLEGTDGTVVLLASQQAGLREPGKVILDKAEGGQLPHEQDRGLAHAIGVIRRAGGRFGSTAGNAGGAEVTVNIALPASRPPSSTLPQKQLTAIVVDDQPHSRRLFSRYLKSEGVEVLSAATGAEALQLAQASTPDFMILDLVLPDMSGYDVIRQLRGADATRQLPVVIVSGSSDTSQSLQAGAFTHLVKPVWRDELRPVVRDLTRLRPRSLVQ